MSSPGLRYYRTVVGRWRGYIDFTITDRRALCESPLTALNKFNLISMVWLVRILGRLAIETTVRLVPDTGGAAVIHTTRITKWAVPLFVSEERIDIDATGRTATIQLRMSTAPLLWRVRTSPPGTIKVDEDGQGAIYHFEWLSAPMEQRGRVSDDGNTVTLEQFTPFSTSRQLLTRVG